MNNSNKNKLNLKICDVILKINIINTIEYLSKYNYDNNRLNNNFLNLFFYLLL